MAAYARPVERLITELSKLPSIGPRSAQRIAFHIIRGKKDDAIGLAEALKEVKERIKPCSRCFNLTEVEECEICRDARRDRTAICVVEDPYDIGPLERTAEYRGLYHVLGGSLSPLDGVEPEDLRIAELVERVRNEGTKELVIATNPNTTGEATALFIAAEVNDLPVRVTALASGLPVGGDLEYADEVTLGRAFAGRREL
ncbi:MAG: recombination protein RecR [Rubrobacter sp.]|nr:recombination protein RecR [Rubrobacteraceae bacterium]MBA3794719.1 recombination protein RecR [Rubrobacter sp.]MDQ3318382.1 recombination mediator RecR [Actinomycetota bacterium]